jgi:tetratricopeptide (TPR) repeat protein
MSWLACGALLALFLGERYGPIGYIAGFPIGLFGASAITQIIIYYYVKLFMKFPTCQRGNCTRFEDYRSGNKGRFFGWDGGGLYLYKCKCGDLYLRDGEKFMEWLPYGGRKGTRVPYKKLNRSGEWEEDEPTSAVEYGNRGDAKGNKGDFEGAIADFSKAIELDPKLADAYSARGRARKIMSKNDGAMTDYNRAIELDPKNALAYLNRGILKSEIGDQAGANADLAQARMLDPNAGK